MARRLPATVLRGRVRTSTAILGVLFVALLALYLHVRPQPAQTVVVTNPDGSTYLSRIVPTPQSATEVPSSTRVPTSTPPPPAVTPSTTPGPSTTSPTGTATPTASPTTTPVPTATAPTTTG